MDPRCLNDLVQLNGLTIISFLSVNPWAMPLAPSLFSSYQKAELN